MHALPGVGAALMRLRRRVYGPRTTVRGTLRLCGVDPGALPADLVERSVQLVARRSDVAGMDRAFLTASRSLAWALVWASTYHAAMAGLTQPVLLVHGERDRLVPVASARAVARRYPWWRYVELPRVGHVRQLQVPALLAGHLRRRLADHPALMGPATPGDRA